MPTSKKRKEVSLTEETIVLLEQQAQHEGRKLKNYMEYVLVQKAKEFELTDAYKKEMDELLAKHKAGELSYHTREEIETLFKS